MDNLLQASTAKGIGTTRPLLVRVLQRHRTNRMCIYIERELFQGIDLHNCGGLMSPKSDGEDDRLEIQTKGFHLESKSSLVQKSQCCWW